MHEHYAAAACCARQLERFRSTESQWSDDEQWMEMLVEISRDRGDDETERMLREWLQSARLHQEAALRLLMEELKLFVMEM